MIKSFRGQLLDGGQDTIRLSTNRGEIGYRIKKFQVIDDEPGENEVEIVAKIYTRFQDTVDNTVNFSDPGLLGMAFYANQGDQAVVSSEVVIFDSVAINQDIFVTAFTHGTDPKINYYLELEQIKLDVSEAAVATLKDMRGSN
jgi:hypothetical protein